MDNGIKLQVKKDFGIKYEISEKDKYDLRIDFAKLFHQCTQMMVWFDNSQISAEQKIEYWTSLFNIFESMHELIIFMQKAGITEKDITEQLDIPF